jgi:hypothetical protein
LGLCFWAGFNRSCCNPSASPYHKELTLARHSKALSENILNFP